MKKLILIVALACLTGCEGKMIPITDEMLGTVSEGSTSKVRYVADASVAKELAVMSALKNRDKMIAKAAKESGLKMDWRPVEKTYLFPGMKQPVKTVEYLPVISYTEMPEFTQPLPTEPSAHPAWKLGEKIVDAGLWGFIGHQAGSVLKAGIEAAGSKTVIDSGGGAITSSGNLSSQSISQKAGGNIQSAASTAPCQGAKCGGGEESGLPEVDSRGTGACSSPPVFGGGIYWFDEVGGCSCSSHKDGKCP